MPLESRINFVSNSAGFYKDVCMPVGCKLNQYIWLKDVVVNDSWPRIALVNTLVRKFDRRDVLFVEPTLVA